MVVKYQNIRQPLKSEAVKTIFVISYSGEKKILSKFLKSLPNIDVYFTRIEWEQRFYLILIFKKGNLALPFDEIAHIKSDVLDKFMKKALVIDASTQAPDEEC